MKKDLFENGSITKLYFALTLPSVCSNLIQLVYNMVDTYFISATGNSMIIAGVSLASPLFLLLIALSDIFGLGGISVVSRLFGAKRTEDANRMNLFAVYGAVAFGIIVAASLLIWRGPILNLLGADSETLVYAEQYYTWIAAGAPVMMFSVVAANMLRAEGLATYVMISSIAASVVNIILDPIFISVLGLGAAGVAEATVISNCVNALILIYVYLRKTRHLKLSLKGFCITVAEVRELVKIGLPASLTNITQTFATVLLNRHLVSFGNDYVAAHGIAMKLNMIIMMTIVGFTFGSQPMIGYAFGAKNKERLTKTLRFIYTYVIILSLVLAAFMSLAAPYLIRFFMDEPFIIEAGSQMLRAIQVSQPFYGICLISIIFFQSTGKALPALIVSLCRQGLFYFIIIELATMAFGYFGTIYTQAAADALTALLCGYLVFRIFKMDLANL